MDYLEAQKRSKIAFIQILRAQLTRLQNLAGKWETRMDRSGLRDKMRLAGMIIRKHSEISIEALRPIPRALVTEGGEKPAAAYFIGHADMELSRIRAEMIQPMKVTAYMVDDSNVIWGPIAGMITDISPAELIEPSPMPAFFNVQIKIISRADSRKRIRKVMRKAKDQSNHKHTDYGESHMIDAFRHFQNAEAATEARKNLNLRRPKIQI